MMQSGMRLEQRKIMVANVRFSNSTKFKRRPVVIITNNEFNKSGRDVVCCPITSNPDNIGIDITNSDLEYGELLRNSKIKSRYPFSLEKGELDKEIGKISLDIARKVIKDIEELINLD